MDKLNPCTFATSSEERLQITSTFRLGLPWLSLILPCGIDEAAREATNDFCSQTTDFLFETDDP
jgi:hypothetical protein